MDWTSVPVAHENTVFARITILADTVFVRINLLAGWREGTAVQDSNKDVRDQIIGKDGQRSSVGFDRVLIG